MWSLGEDVVRLVLHEGFWKLKVSPSGQVQLHQIVRVNARVVLLVIYSPLWYRTWSAFRQLTTSMNTGHVFARRWRTLPALGHDGKEWTFTLIRKGAMAGLKSTRLFKTSQPRLDFELGPNGDTGVEFTRTYEHHWQPLTWSSARSWHLHRKSGLRILVVCGAVRLQPLFRSP